MGVVPWLKEPVPEIDPPEPATRARLYDLMEKLAVSDLAWDMDTVVVAEPELATPSPVQLEKSYPVLGVATIVGLVP